jgi:hypothetical protein
MTDIYQQVQQNNVTEHIEIQQNDTKHNDIQQSNKSNKTLSIMPSSIMA